MVVAILMTCGSASVLLYLGVSVALTFALSVSFHVAFGTHASQFSTLGHSVLALFNMVRIMACDLSLCIIYSQTSMLLRDLPMSGMI